MDTRLISKFRKAIETVISNLTSLDIQSFKSPSISGFEARLEAILLAYIPMLEKAQTIIPNTLRYSKGCF